jgi:hypothetical protein
MNTIKLLSFEKWKKRVLRANLPDSDDIMSSMLNPFEECEECNGDGSTECGECGQDVSCEVCDGTGQIDRLKEIYDIQLESDKKILKSLGIEMTK